VTTALIAGITAGLVSAMAAPYAYGLGVFVTTVSQTKMKIAVPAKAASLRIWYHFTSPSSWVGGPPV